MLCRMRNLDMQQTLGRLAHMAGHLPTCLRKSNDPNKVEKAPKTIGPDS